MNWTDLIITCILVGVIMLFVTYHIIYAVFIQPKNYKKTGKFDFEDNRITEETNGEDK